MAALELVRPTEEAQYDAIWGVYNGPRCLAGGMTYAEATDYQLALLMGGASPREAEIRALP